ncbi:MAG: hypothetical protein APG12_00029 [Candidatus Methanofastidiosum methylothiophilum]|uniref:Uncharacterized protein n=1 Tax=Candidatus Methanofastidiosum methylothiophilum TaxID=1705564 RepID=A0A150IUP0_9EURY|nr:MAG: hypothetical protein APG10_01002 [Candidatus Methanofastidiosum methylthiophilus]KYC48719.1 MAG: hypothetical protein APG11_00030 [Candidatus Methanofastidiosum methylthiophilus]KYC51367.1 MAG: hypothetical protein APG12_00029 [Candidatus Methanofastidiosum methylthiophilus]
MTAKKYVSALFAIALILSVVPFAFAEDNGLGDTNSTSTDGGSNSSTIDQKLADETKEFYDTMLDLFSNNQDSNMSTVVILPTQDTNSTGGDTNASTGSTDANTSFGLNQFTLGEYQFYLGLNEEGYYFGDVNGSVYFIQKADLPISVSVHLSKLIPTMEKIQLAIEEGNIGRAYGLLNSLEARMTASARYIVKHEEQEQKKLEIQERKQNKFEEKRGESNSSSTDVGPSNNSNKEDKSNNGNGNPGSNNGNGNSGNGNGNKK